MPYAPHIEGYLNGPEFEAFIKQNCPDSPKKFTIYQFRRTNAGDTVRFMRQGHFLYVSEEDMRTLIKNKHISKHKTNLHIPGWLTYREASDIIAQTHDKAPCKTHSTGIRKRIEQQNIRTMYQGGVRYIHEDDFRRAIAERPFYARVSDVEGWVSRAEVQRIIAEDNPYAPKKFAVENLALVGGPRAVRRRKFGHRYLYNLEDLKRELKRMPIYDNANKITRRSLITSPYHDLLPEDADMSVWMPVPKAAEVLGLRSRRVHQLISKYRVKALAHQGKLYVNINDVRTEAALRPDSFIRKHGLDPHQFKAVRFVNAYYCGYTIRYCPELMDK